jgi:hypothetical protein
MVDELDDLRDAIASGNYALALEIIDELDEMSRSDKINKIKSYMRVLLTHLMKQDAEQRSTRSWTDSIDEALDSIADTNKRPKSGGYYLDDDALAIALEESWRRALRKAAREAFEGKYEPDELEGMINRQVILANALERIRATQSS